MQKHIVFITGAGISQESGIATFRESGGLWEKHRIEDVASPQGFQKNPKLVLDFYNKRRRQLKRVQPNEAHRLISKLEEHYRISVITQNVDDLHERAGSENVLHLHGELNKVRSTEDPRLIYDWTDDLNLGDTCEKGYQLRPHIVWFGESVPAIEQATSIVRNADLLVVVGSSLQVYPAAGLLLDAPKDCEVYYIDPKPAYMPEVQVTVIKEKASTGMKVLVDHL